MTQVVCVLAPQHLPKKPDRLETVYLNSDLLATTQQEIYLIFMNLSFCFIFQFLKNRQDTVRGLPPKCTFQIY